MFQCYTPEKLPFKYAKEDSGTLKAVLYNLCDSGLENLAHRDKVALQDYSFSLGPGFVILTYIK